MRRHAYIHSHKQKVWAFAEHMLRTVGRALAEAFVLSTGI